MDIREFTDCVYDELLKNEGMSEHHLGFDVDTVKESMIAPSSGFIYVKLDDGTAFELQIKQVEAVDAIDYFGRSHE